MIEDKHCCGVPHGHPLAAKDVISLEDLRGQTIVMYARGITRADDKLRDYLQDNLVDIDILDIHKYNSSIALKCQLSGAILIYYSMYGDSFPALAQVPIEMDIQFPIDIGLGYRISANATIKNFIRLAKELYPAV